ncbi:MAG: RNA methyltransferase [Planctomycetes bacterium]|nr:RNA methyltransferase [Planctomycetota bacterium]
MTREFFASCTLGLEEALSAELRALGAGDVRVQRGGAAFTGDARLGMASCLWLRSAIRVQETLLRATCASVDELAATVGDVPWEDYMRLEDTLAVAASVRDAPTTHSGFAALRVKDAVVDRFRRRTGSRPDVDSKRPVLPLRLLWQGHELTLGRDLAGASLHKRGARPVQVKSPLNEATAAGLLLLAGWDGQSALADPMCGSATFLVEAAMIAVDRAPGLQRRFAFERWPDTDGSAWEQLKDEARGRVKQGVQVPLMGVDRHAGAVVLARRHASAAGVSHLLDLDAGDCARWTPRVRPEWVFVNPPYGERLGEGDDLVGSWRSLSTFLREQCGGAKAHVLSGDAELTKSLGMKASRKWPVMNGTIDCRLLRYEVFAKR